MKKKVAIILAVLLAISLFVGCGADDPAPSENDTVQQPADEPAEDEQDPAEQSGRDDVIIQLAGDITSFNPFTHALAADSFVYRQIYDTLLHLTPDGELEYRLAESFTVNEDSTVFTFRIREGVLFHNGDELQASDVVFTLLYYLESPFLSTFVGGIADARDLGDNVVEVTMHYPNSPFLLYLAEMVPILSERAITEAGEDYDDAPVGTGPYMFVSYARGNQIVLTRFEDYWRGPAPIRDVTLRIIPDTTTAVIALQAGDIDFSIVMPPDFESVNNDPNLTIGYSPMQSGDMVILNHGQAPFDDVLVRQAASYAIDREFILEATREGLGEVATNILPPGVFGHSPDIEMTYHYNPERAMELLAQAGITEPIDIGTIITIEPFALTAQIVQQNLADVGLVGTVEVMEIGRLNESLVIGDFGIGVIQITLSADADSWSAILIHENIDGMNFARYYNPLISELFASARQTADPDERLEIYTELFRIVGEEVAYITVVFPRGNFAWNHQLNAPPIVNIHIFDMYWD